MKGIHNLCIHLEGHFATEDNVFSTKGKGVIRDLVAMRTKGAPKTQNWKKMEDGYTAGFDSYALEEIKMFNHMEEPCKFGNDAFVGANYNDEGTQCTNEDKA
ncbi:uncharacterized protein DS421_1g11380 [Arachis hypogaea]|nr:uncharacterized protein DS421_1g11380 [Arachis hypogaea]